MLQKNIKKEEKVKYEKKERENFILYVRTG